MDNYLVIDHIDLLYLHQSSLSILLQKQIARNYYLFKKHHPSTQDRTPKIYIKTIARKIKTSFDHIALAKFNQLITKPNSYHAVSKLDRSAETNSIKRRTEQSTKQFRYNLFSLNSSTYNSKNKLKHMPAVSEAKKSKTEKGHIKATQHLSAFIVEGALQKQRAFVQYIKENFKEKEKVSLERLFIPPKYMVSLNNMELNISLNKKNVPSIEELNSNNKLHQIQKLLVRSSINSPRRNLVSTSSSEYKDLRQNQCIKLHETEDVKREKFSQRLREMYKKSCNQCRQVLSINRTKLFENGEQQSQNEKKELKCSKKNDMKRIANTKQAEDTKESDNENGNQTESVLQSFMHQELLQRKNNNKKKLNCQKSQNAMVEEMQKLAKNGEDLMTMRSYRISKIKNIKFPVF